MRDTKIALAVVLLTTLSACSATNSAGFKLVTLQDHAGCEVLLDGSTPVTFSGKSGIQAFAVGDSCPANMPGTDISLSKRPSIAIDSSGKFVRVLSSPDNKGSVTKTVVRRGDYSTKKKGPYAFYYTKQ